MRREHRHAESDLARPGRSQSEREACVGEGNGHVVHPGTAVAEVLGQDNVVRRVERRRKEAVDLHQGVPESRSVRNIDRLDRIEGRYSQLMWLSKRCVEALVQVGA